MSQFSLSDVKMKEKEGALPLCTKSGHPMRGAAKAAGPPSDFCLHFEIISVTIPCERLLADDAPRTVCAETLTSPRPTHLWWFHL